MKNWLKVILVSILVFALASYVGFVIFMLFTSAHTGILTGLSASLLGVAVVLSVIGVTSWFSYIVYRKWIKNSTSE